MAKRNNWVLLFIVAILAFSLWVLFPIDSTRFGRTGIQYGLDLKGGVRLVYQVDLSAVTKGTEKTTMDGVAQVIANRVNPLGVTEPNITRLGADQLVVELPMPAGGFTETQKERLGRTALLEFREQSTVTNADGTTSTVWIPATGTLNGEQKVLNSSYFKSNTYVGTSSSGTLMLFFEFNADGAILSKEITTRLLNKPLGIFEGSGTDALPLLGDNNQPIAPTVQGVIEDKGEITGLSLKESSELSKQLNAGRLPVPLKLIAEMNIDPSLGADFIKLAVRAGIIGIAGVMLFLVAYYRVSGMIAVFALSFYGILTLAIYKVIPVTMTLSGIGGFVLSIGMAIDANVLIFERMKEELANRITLASATEAGFSRAWSAIWDSNLTTILACVILYWVGSSVAFGGTVKGFALTLGIGVIISMFTAVLASHAVFRLVVRTGLARQIELFKPYTGRRNAR